MINSNTIVAIATPPGEGAIGIVRMSGENAFDIAAKIIRNNKKFAKGYKIHFVKLYDEENNLIDEAIMAVFKAPKSYTKENIVEFYCHGSPYILQKVVQTAICFGAKPAEPGEFTMRAFLNGNLDLTQAEAVANLISAKSAKAHQVAMNQLKGSISNKLKHLRQSLIKLTSLVELELDFSEEDVEFADRTELVNLIQEIKREIKNLLESFKAGNAIKSGIPTAIVGKPNVGKSTLLNILLNENRAIVSNIPGTTRDIIEESIFINGYEFRLIDTAGVRQNTQDPIEMEGIKRTKQALKKASLIIYLFDISETSPEEARKELEILNPPPESKRILVANKTDLLEEIPDKEDIIFISAKHNQGIDNLIATMTKFAQELTDFEVLLTSPRHYNALSEAYEAIEQVENAVEMGISGELLSIDLRIVLDAIGKITGEIVTDDILSEIFSNFCIGK